MGGDRDVLPAAARPPRRRRAAHAVADAGPVRPARGAGRAGPLPRVPRRRSASSRTAATSRRPRGERRRRRRARALGARSYERARERLASGRRPARARSAATSPGPRRRRTRSCRCSPPTPACACSCAPGSTRTAAASATAGAAGCGCPSARTRRGSTRCSRRPACTPSCVDLTDVLEPDEHLRPLRTRGRPAARADRPRDDRARLEPRRLPGGRRATATTTTSRRTATAPGPTTARRTTPTRAADAARRHAADFVARTRERVAGGGLAVCAVDTELLGDWWHEGPLWLAAVVDEAARAGPAARRASTTRSTRHEPAAAPAGPARHDSWGTPRDLTTWSAPPVSRHGLERPRRRAAHRRGGRAAPTRAPSASCSRCSPATGRFSSRSDLAEPYGRERAAGHRAALDAALARPERSTRGSATSHPTLRRRRCSSRDRPGRIAASQTFFPQLADESQRVPSAGGP